MTLHGSQPSILEEQPVVHLVPFTATLGVRNLVLGIVALNKVQHDASRLEQVDRLTVGELVSHCRNSAIGVDGEEPVFLLRVFADVDLLDLVRKAVIVSKVDISDIA